MNTISTNDEAIAVSKRQLAATVQRGDEQVTDSADCPQLGREHFQHKQQVLDDVRRMLELLENREVGRARSLAQAIGNILDMYQEDSVLLDPHVPEIASPLVALISSQVLSKSLDLEVCRLPSSVLFILAKVCGYRSMSASGVFPHSFNYLDPLVSLLQSSEAACFPWEIRFVLLLWLSVLLLLPFNLSIVLSNGTVQSITAIALRALSDSTHSVSKAGAVVLGRLLSRDVSLIDSFLKESSTECGLGILETINQTLKMLPSRITDQHMIDALFHLVHSTSLSIPPGADVRAKVLRVRISAKLVNDTHHRSQGFIQRFLGDRDYLVRWAAAKALGRVGDSNTLQLLLQPQSNPQDALLFQGRSLAVAELIVRSSSSTQPRTLHSSTDFTSQIVALACAGLEHPTTVATWQVRDAASYIIWALARSLLWTPQLIDEVFTQALLPALLTVCLFDREISCRRVAAAALQELIGRIGTTNFAPGMPLLEAVDFWAVADLKTCFQDLASQVLAIVEDESLRVHFIDHLVNLKLVHPTDKDLRSLAARSLTKIISRDHAQFVESAINSTVLNAESSVTARQGGLELLTSAVQTWSADVWRSEELQTAIRNVVPKLEKERLYRGKGGEMIRIAACRLIEALAGNDNIAFKPATSDRYLQTVLEGLRHLVSGVQMAAAKALFAITAKRVLASSEVFDKLKSTLVDKNENVAARRGAVLGLAFLSPRFTEARGLTGDLVTTLHAEALAWPKHPLGVTDFVDAEARKFAVLGLARVADSVPSHRDSAVSACLAASEDFQVDQRGDVGSWVREAAINGLACLAPLSTAAVEALAARSCERLDRVRGLASLRLHGLVNGQRLHFSELEATLAESQSDSQAVVLKDVVYSTTDDAATLFAPDCDPTIAGAVTAAFRDPPHDRPELSSARSAWSSSPCVFRRCCSLLSVETLQIPVLRSLVNAVGGVTAESVGEAARAELLAAAVGVPAVLELLVRLFAGAGEPARCSTRQERNNRFITPVINSLAFLVRESPAEKIAEAVLQRVAEEIAQSRDVHKLRAATALLLELCVVSEDARRTLVHSLLNSPFPAIRHAAASGLYLKLVEEEALEEVADILASTDWTSEEGVWKDEVLRICSLLQLEPPTRESTPPDEMRFRSKANNRRATPAYAELVKEEHW